jgi:hypothetical protein
MCCNWHNDEQEDDSRVKEGRFHVLSTQVPRIIALLIVRHANQKGTLSPTVNTADVECFC